MKHIKGQNGDLIPKQSDVRVIKVYQESTLTPVHGKSLIIEDVQPTSQNLFRDFQKREAL
jgi:hypothetical protein